VNEADLDFLASPETRPVRLQLEFLQVELALRRAGIEETVVVVGGTQVLEREKAEARLAAARAEPDGPGRDRAVAIADRILAKAHYYDAAVEFGRLAAKGGLTVVTGGGPGIMEAANRGADGVGCFTAGFNITLPAEQQPNRFISPGLSFQFRYFALRKMHFLLRARGLVCFPGGFGTLDELLDALTLRQTGRMQPVPIVLFGRSYWDRVLDLGFLADEGAIDDADRELVQYAETPAEAWGIVRG